MVKIGLFEFNPVTSEISGPADYFNAQGNRLLASILAGNDVIFNTTAHFSPTPETAVLVRLQTDYAGWRGVQGLLEAFKGSVSEEKKNK